MKDLCGKVLRLFAAAGAPRDEGIHPGKILFVQLSEVRSLTLRSFNQQPVIRFTLKRLHCTLPRFRSLNCSWGPGGKKLRGLALFV